PALVTASDADHGPHAVCQLFLFPPTAAPDSVPLSLHDALPIFMLSIEDILKSEFVNVMSVDLARELLAGFEMNFGSVSSPEAEQDRKSTRLNSSHVSTSYAVFCLKKKSITAGTETSR